MKKMLLLLKSHVSSYTRADGTYVPAHDTRTLKFVSVPHPQKPGERMLGTYKGERNQKAVVGHGELEFEVEPHHVLTHVAGESAEDWHSNNRGRPDVDEFHRQRYEL